MFKKLLIAYFPVSIVFVIGLSIRNVPIWTDPEVNMWGTGMIGWSFITICLLIGCFTENND